MNKKEMEQMLAAAFVAGLKTENKQMLELHDSLELVADRIEADISPDGKDILFVMTRPNGETMCQTEFKLVKRGRKFVCVENPHSGIV